MDKTKKGILGMGVIAVIAFVFAFAASGSGVIGQDAEGNGGGTVAASAVTNSINYQGRLTDNAGEPLSGAHEMTFKLYEVDSGGTALDTDTHSVTVTDGLFNTYIDFAQSYFDGRALWLGIAVGKDAEMMPRQEFKPVPYALSLKPGAEIKGETDDPVIKAENAGDGTGVSGIATGYGGIGVHGLGGLGTGVRGEGEIGVSGKSGIGPGVTGEGVVGVHGKSDVGSGVYGTSTSSYGYGVYGSAPTGVYGKGGKYGGHFTTDRGGTASYNKTACVNATTSHDYSDGVRTSTTGYDSDGVHAYTTGNNSEGVLVYTTGYFSEGVFAETTGYGSDGVRAKTTGGNSQGISANTYGNGSEGVYVHTHGDDSDGVRAHTHGDNSYGVSAYTWGDNSDAVRAYTSGHDSDGVCVETSGGWSDGVYAETTGDDSDGVCVDTSGDGSYGVYVDTSGDDSDGVYVETTGDLSYGVRAYTSGENSVGVHAYSAKSYGVFGRTDSADRAGVYARGKDSGADLILGGNAVGGVGDDGKIYSDPAYASSDIYLVTNDGLRIDLDNDSNGEDADFEIRDKDDNLIFNVDESGDVSYGGPNIAAFPRPAYDSGWVSISRGKTKTLTHNLGGNPDKYVVDMQFYSSSLGRHQLDYGSQFRTALSVHGANWEGLDGTQIKVGRGKHDPKVEKVRIRIWVYK